MKYNTALDEIIEGYDVVRSVKAQRIMWFEPMERN